MLKRESYHRLTFDFLYAPLHRIFQLVRVKKDCFKTYFNAQHVLIKLTGVERCFLEYLIEHADMQNLVYVDVYFKENYLRFLKDKLHLKTVPAQNKLNKILRKLLDMGLLMKEDNKQAFYRVNPKYFWKGSESSRLETIRGLIISRSTTKLPFHFLLDKPEEEFLKNMST
jgi:hypothetical protein